MSRRAYQTDLTDEQWLVVRPLLPNVERKRKHSLREIINALFYHTRAGGAWRLLPHDFPAWETAYGSLTGGARTARWKACMTACENEPGSKQVEKPPPAPPSWTASL